MIVTEERMIRELRKIGRIGAAQRKWQQIRQISDANVSARGDIVAVFLAAEPMQSEFAFIKYRERLGIVATAFIQPIFAVRMGDLPDDQLLTWHEALTGLIDRVVALHAAADASGAEHVQLQLAGHGRLREEVAAILESGLSFHQGIPILLNGDQLNRDIEGDRLGEPSIPYADGWMRRMLEWEPPERPEPDPFLKQREALVLSSPEAWRNVHLNPTRLGKRAQATLGHYSDMHAAAGISSIACDPADLHRRLVNSQIGTTRRDALLSAAEAVSKAKHPSFIVCAHEIPQAIGGVNLALDIQRADLERWHIAVEVDPVFMPVGTKHEEEVAFEAGCRISAQIIADLKALTKSILHRTKIVHLDVGCAQPVRSENDPEIILVGVVSTWINVLRQFLSRKVVLGHRFIFPYVEPEILDLAEQKGIGTTHDLSRRMPDKPVYVEPYRPFHFGGPDDELDAAASIAERVRISILSSTKSSEGDAKILRRLDPIAPTLDGVILTSPKIR